MSPFHSGTQYLKAENEVLRAQLPVRVTITPQERQRLLKFGARLGKGIHQTVTIVTPSTFLRWIREDRRANRKKLPAAKRGRRRTAEQIRKLIIKLAKENHWGYLDSVAATYKAHYLKERPHQGKDNELLSLSKSRKRRSTAKYPSAADALALGDKRNRFSGDLVAAKASGLSARGAVSEREAAPILGHAKFFWALLRHVFSSTK